MAASKILVLGASSYVGQHLFRRLGQDACLATYNSVPFDGGVRFNSLDMRIADIIEHPNEYSHAVVLLGDTQPDSCIADPARSKTLNVDSVVSIFDQLSALNIKPVFTSSEFVFDGSKGHYAEDDTAEPILLYGEQKLEAERYLGAMGVPHAILRLAKVYGDTPGDGTLFTGWIETLGEDTSLRCAADQAFSPVYVGDVVDAIMHAMTNELEGTYHVSGNQRFTRLELLEMVLGEFRDQGRELPVDVEPCSIHDFELPERRPVDVSMTADKLAAETGMTFTDPHQVCAALVSRRFQETRV